VRLVSQSMRTHKLPSLPVLISELTEERIIHYRKFFAELRLNRLHFHLIILNYFSNFDTPENSQSFSRELENYFSFFKKMDSWLGNLKDEGLYLEFREQCLDEIKVIEQIIQSYEGKMKN
jgi:hypothetical protein